MFFFRSRHNRMREEIEKDFNGLLCLYKDFYESYRRRYKNMLAENLRLTKENNRLKTSLHHYNAVACDDCIFNVNGVCAHNKSSEYDRCDKKKCAYFARPLKSLSKCSHRNNILMNDKARDASGYDYICLDCGTLIK